MKRFPLVILLSLSILVPCFSQAQQQVMLSYGSSGGGSSTLNTSLISYWKLDETSGTRADSKGSNNLTDNNTVTFNTGKIGNAGQFTDANSEYLSIASNSTLQTGNIDYTFACWVYLDSKSGIQPVRTFIGKDSSTLGREYSVRFNNLSDRFEFNAYTAGDTEKTVTANNFGSPSLSTWYFITAWYDSAATTMYISVNNGTADSNNIGTSLQTAGTAAFNIGQLGYSGSFPYYMDGRIDEVGFWKKVLSPSERTELYNSGSGKTCCPF